MKKFIASFAFLLPALCLAPCQAEDISWDFGNVPVQKAASQASGEEWFTMENGHLFHEKTGWYWNPVFRQFYRPAPEPIRPIQMQFAPMQMGGFQGDYCPPGKT